MFGYSLVGLIQAFGYFGIFSLTFAETGLLIGSILPGDSMLFTVGFLSAQGYLHPAGSMLTVIAGALIGDFVGYNFGRRVGPRIFRREDSFYFHKDQIVRAEKLFERHGRKIIVVARFVPLLRSFIPTLAGVGKMPPRIFYTFSFIGALLWTGVFVGSGYFLSSRIPHADRYLPWFILGVLIVTGTPALTSVIRQWYKHRKAKLKK